MAFIDLVRARHSVRSYTTEPVTADELAPVLEAGRLAPSAVNYQPTRVAVCSEPERLEAIGRACPRFVKNGSIFGAPLVLVVCANHALSYKRKYDGRDFADIDASIVCDHMMMAATEQGLGTCWVGHFDPAVAQDALGLPDDVEPVHLLVMGHPDEKPVDVESHLYGRRNDLRTFLDPEAR